MPEPLHQDTGPMDHPEVSTEPRDASFPWILGIILGAALSAVAIFVGVWLFFVGWRDHEAQVKRSPFPLAPTPTTTLPREPRLEQLDRLAGVETPNVYLRQASREALLHRYGPTDEKGFVHIPITRAMDLLADKPPATRAQPSAEQERRAEGQVDAGPSNSGRPFRRSQP